MQIPDDLRYSTDHEWIRVEGGKVRIGITDYAQDALGDVVFVDLPEVGAAVEAAASISEVGVHQVGVRHLRSRVGHDRRGQRRSRPMPPSG